MRTVVVLGVVVIGIVLLLVITRSRGSDSTATEYGGGARSVVVLGAEGGAAKIIHVYEPKDGARVRLDDLDKIQFRWSSVPGVERYLFVVNNEVGQPVWRAMVPDTVFTLAGKVKASVIPGVRLKWIVQGPPQNASSDIQRIEITQ